MSTMILVNLHLISRSDLLAALRHELARRSLHSGVYKLVWRIDGAETAIQRLLAADTMGTLYIGQSRDLCARVGSLFAALRDPASRAHYIGVKYARHPGLQDRIPLRQLAIEVHPHPAPKTLEKELLAAYVATFGEGPPWNVRTL